MKNLLFVLICLLPFAAQAEKTNPAEPKVFDVIDGNAPIAGEPGDDTQAARAKWLKACNEWKDETKEMNKSNQVISLVCGSADCVYQDNGNYVCSSTAVYKLKTEGAKAPPAPLPSPAKTETFVTAVPQRPIVEVVPVWGWQSHIHRHSHNWHHGHWQPEQPSHIWIGHKWNRHGVGWHFEIGH